MGEQINNNLLFRLSNSSVAITKNKIDILQKEI